MPPGSLPSGRVCLVPDPLRTAAYASRTTLGGVFPERLRPLVDGHRRPVRPLPGGGSHASTWWGARCATPSWPIPVSGRADADARPRPHHRRPARRDRGAGAAAGPTRSGPRGSASAPSAACKGGQQLRDHHPPGRGLPPGLAQARGRLRRRHRGRPVPARLHRQRHGAPPARPRARSTPSTGSATWPRTGCARRSTPRSPSPTTRCACSGRPGSSPASTSSPTAELVAAVASACTAASSIVSAERIRDELDKIVMVAGALGRPLVRRADRAWPTSSCPSCPASRSSRTRSTATRTCSPTPWPWSTRPSPDRLLRLAALFHDVGKPRTRAFGRRRGDLPPPRGGRAPA